METNVIYSLFSFISIMICTYLYARALHKIEKYWEFIVYSKENVILNVFLITHFGVLILLLSYILEAVGAILIQYYLKFFASAVFLVASIGLDRSLKSYIEDPKTLEVQYQAYLDSKSKTKTKIKTTKEDLFTSVDDSIQVITCFTQGEIKNALLINKLFLQDKFHRVALIGRTHPKNITSCPLKVWFTFYTRSSEDYVIISPNNVSPFITFLNTTLNAKENDFVFLGDFMETILNNNAPKNVFNFVDMIISHIRNSNSKLVLFIPENIVDAQSKSILTNVSDTVVYIRNIAKKGELVTQFTIKNLVKGTQEVVAKNIYH